MSGLRYQTEGRLRYYEPDGPFYVDDIYYDPNATQVQWATMLTIRDDASSFDGEFSGGPATARITLSDPMTDDELDDWVHTGKPSAW